MTRVFLLSPANSGGERMRILTRAQAAFPLAVTLRESGAPLSEVFSFASGLYFRGKVAYARAFARPPRGVPGGLVIAPGRGLLPLDHAVTPRDLAAFARVDVDAANAKFRAPLSAAARALAESLGDDGEAVLLGSIASGKYVEILEPILGARLRFPPAFVGRGDLSRGGLMLRSARAGEELDYIAVSGAVRRGKRPPRLPRIPPPIGRGQGEGPQSRSRTRTRTRSDRYR